MRARMYARMYARAYVRASDCGQMVSGHTTTTGTPTEHTTGKERNTGKAEKPVYICMIAGNEKKYKKKLKKIWKYEKAAVSL